MTDYKPRLFDDEAEIVRIGEGLLERTLPRLDWTYEAHLAATTYLLTRRTDIDVDRQLPGIIRGYNESVGGVNSDTEAITRRSRAFSFTASGFSSPKRIQNVALHELVNELLLSPMGRCDWPLRFYSPKRLFSTEARRKFIEPDLAALP